MTRMLSSLAVVLTSGVLLTGAAYAQVPCKSSDIKGRVCSLATGYLSDPSQNVPSHYQVAACDPDTPVGNADTEVQKAFELAPERIQSDICSLHQIFVFDDAKTPGSSWGKWEEPTRYGTQSYADCGPSGCSFVGIASSVFNSSLGSLEDKTLSRFNIDTKTVTHKHTVPAPGGRPSFPSTRIAVLATLAHEVAHIKFRRDGVRYAPCFYYHFVNLSWDTPPDTVEDARQRNWLAFATPYGSNMAVPKPSNATAADVEKIYTSGFATAFASNSPEEDYVETYKLRAILADKAGKLELTGLPSGNNLTVNSPDRTDLQIKFEAGPPCF